MRRSCFKGINTCRACQRLFGDAVDPVTQNRVDDLALCFALGADVALRDGEGRVSCERLDVAERATHGAVVRGCTVVVHSMVPSRRMIAVGRRHYLHDQSVSLAPYLGRLVACRDHL